MLTEEELQKKWESLTFTDDFIFARVMRNKNLCRRLLEMILKVKIGKIKFLTSQHSIQIEPTAKGIIMDVYLKDKSKVINVEMQTSNHQDLAFRSRYYQAAADIDTTPKGSEYKDLKQNYVIFICTFDPFYKGKPSYTFQNFCLEHEEPIYLGDGTTKIFLNTAAKDLSNLDLELRLFYDYVKGDVAQSDFTQELSRSISQIKKEKEERQMYLTYTSRMMDSRRDGFEEGLVTGREEGISIGLERGAYQNKLKTARKLLSMGLSLEQVVQGTSLPMDVVQEMVQESDKTDSWCSD